jgi:ABC-type transport system substrate-binding protein
VSACDSTTCSRGCDPFPLHNYWSVLAVGAPDRDLKSLDPAHVTGNAPYEIARLIFPSLMTLDTNLKPIDWAAQTHEISEDGLTWTFHLNKGMKWSDSYPIDSVALAYSLNVR